MEEKIYKFTKGEGYNKIDGRPFLSTYRKIESELNPAEKDLLFGELISAWNNTPDEIKNKFLTQLTEEYHKNHRIKLDDLLNDLCVEGKGYYENEIMPPPKWTNSMSITRKNKCEKCGTEDAGMILFVEKDSIFYCCEICAKKYNLTALKDLMK